MAGIINIQKLDRLRSITAHEMPLYGASPDGFENHLQEIPRKGIWISEPNKPTSFLSAQDPKFVSVQNDDTIGMIDGAAYDRGIELQAESGWYHGGRTQVNFTLPGYDFKVPGDPSPMKPGFIWGNHYGGGGCNLFDPYSERHECSNGQVFMTRVGKAIKKKHYGSLSEKDIYIMVCQNLDRLDDFVQVIKMTTEISAATVMTDMQILNFLLRLEKKTAKKYHETVSAVVADNVERLGNNVNAVAQGISEAYTHHMDAPAHGGTKLAWRDGAVDRLLKETMVKETVEASIGR